MSMKKEEKASFLLRKNKKGLSEVVATLLVILLVIIAIGIIWTVLRNLFKGGSDEISFSGLTLDLGITRASVVGGTTTIGVKRNIGSGDISGVKFIFFDGQNSHSVEKDTTMSEGEEETFTITPGDVAGVEDGWTVSIAPIYLSSSGAENLGEVSHTITLGDLPGDGGGDGGGEGAGEGEACSITADCAGELECIDGTCQEVGGEGEECDAENPCGIGFTCSEGSCSCNYAQTEGIIDDKAAACTAEGFECGIVTICGEENIDCGVELSECELGEYCSETLCLADTFANQGTVEEVFTSSEPFQILSADIPDVSVTNLQGKWMSFVDLAICRQISFHGPVPEGTGFYVRLTATAPGITEGVTDYNVWENSECGGYY